MSSVGSALLRSRLSRSELEKAFCARLTDECLTIAYGSQFDGRLLWAQRDEANIKLASNGIPIPSVESSKL